MSYAYKPLHWEGLGHAFVNIQMYLDYDRKGFDFPSRAGELLRQQDHPQQACDQWCRAGARSPFAYAQTVL